MPRSLRALHRSSGVFCFLQRGFPSKKSTAEKACECVAVCLTVCMCVCVCVCVFVVFGDPLSLFWWVGKGNQRWWVGKGNQRDKLSALDNVSLQHLLMLCSSSSARLESIGSKRAQAVSHADVQRKIDYTLLLKRIS